MMRLALLSLALLSAGAVLLSQRAPQPSAAHVATTSIKPSDWDDPLFHLSPTLFVSVRGASTLYGDATRALQTKKPPVLDPSIRLMQADAARLAARLRSCSDVEVGYDVALDWGKKRLPLIQYLSALVVPQHVRHVLVPHLVPQVPLSTAIATVEPWSLARSAWTVAPLRTTRVLAQLGWLLMVQKIERRVGCTGRAARRVQRVIPRILNSLAAAIDKMADRAL